MGRLPAYLFVVRHGNRLDAVDTQWHLSSPTPYDPPLTYGGWIQSKALGARIASILREREAEYEAASRDAQPSQPRRRRRHRVIIHSSPFLRCVQTSIAISAGLASNPPKFVSAPSSTENVPAQTRPSRVSQISSFSSPAPIRSRPSISTDLHSLQPSQTPVHIEKAVLRLDPFLGEWGAPEYFEHITPPPKSSLMLMSAVADLLRAESNKLFPSHSPRVIPSTPSKLWNSPTQSSFLDSPSGSGLDHFSELSTVLAGSKSDASVDHKAGHKASLSDPAVPKGYMSPVPVHPVSTSHPIPHGYVTHARDACVDFDHQWDSMHDDLAWGEGGIVPEEWAAMHHRFRRGLKRLVNWYATTDSPEQMVTKAQTTPNTISFNSTQHDENGSAVDDDDDEFDYEPIVILVSHGAGGNALAGAISNHPIIADVPTSSLTVAQRRPEFDDSSNVVDPRAVASLDDALLRAKLTIPELYELKMFASTDHLLSSSPTPVTRPSSGSMSSFDQRYGAPNRDSYSRFVNASLGSMRRASPKPAVNWQSPSTVTAGKGGTASFTTQPSHTNSWGLWSPGQKSQATSNELKLDLPTNLKHTPEITQKRSGEPFAETEEGQKDGNLPALLSNETDNGRIVTGEEDEEDDKFEDDVLPNFSGSGLWGNPRPPGEAERKRDFTSMKRRWTVNER